MSLLAPVLLLLAQDPGPLAPEAALRTIRVPAGFRVELVASEPEVVDPVAMAFDADGRIYAAEMRDYPLGPPSGRIKLLEDRDRDGRFERSSVFADGVPFPTGVMPWKGGVLVCAAPDILFMKDTDGDGKADLREVVLTGFGTGENPQSFVNNLEYGIDNWIWGANGGLGGNLRWGDAKGAPPGTIRGNDFRFKPGAREFELVSGRSQYANALDDWGRRFTNTNSQHLLHPVLPLRAVKDNPHLAVASLEESLPDHGDAARVFPVSPIGKRFNDPAAAGHFTSACGLAVYRGGAFPPEYRGNIFGCEPVHNVVHRDVLVPKGASFTAVRGEKDSEFLASTDPWCRPVNLANGPDGALYVVDFYRYVVDHPKFITLEDQKKLDLLAGNDKGRIYRVVHASARPSPRPRLSSASTSELLEHLASGNGWWRTAAQRLLVERQAGEAAEPLARLAREARSPLARAHALWTLEGLSKIPAGLVADRLRDPDPGVRELALRLKESPAGDFAGWADIAASMADDPDPRVRFRLALAAVGVPGGAFQEMRARIAERDAADRWTRTAVLAGVTEPCARFLGRLGRGFLEKPGTGALELVRGLASLVAARRDEGEMAGWIGAAAAGGGEHPRPWQQAALSALPSLRRAGVPVGKVIEKSGAEEALRAWAAKALGRALDPARSEQERVDALELHALGAGPETSSRLRTLLRAQEPQEVQVAAVRLFGDPAPLLDGWAGYTPRVRREILEGLLRRGNAAPVLEALEKGELRAVDLEPGHRERLEKHSDRARKLLEPRASDRDELVRELSPKVLALAGDRLRGEKMYLTNCASCHRWFGQGSKVGPDLATVVGKEKKLVLVDILDPNRQVDPAYRVYVVKTAAGEMVTGIISAETPGGITLRRAMGEETTVLRRDIAEMKAWPASIMADGIENNLKAQDFADLLEFLFRGPSR
jgi:putative membrane-bound dehydrogenase-like protein